MPRYNPAIIEPKWQAYWEENQTFATLSLPPAGAPKLYALDMFPYPSGSGLHVGHPEGYTATDIVCRAARMQGKAVMHPMGFDAFGLPAEEHAIKTGEHPRIQTERNIDTFRRQLKMLGFSYDWQREIATTDTDYVRWTQWIFLQIYDTWFDRQEQRGRPISELPIPQSVADQGPAAVAAYQDEHRLAYQSEAPVNWCPALGTVLANEEVIDGKSERGGHPVVRMPLRQWMLRITAYAERLERDLDSLDWSTGVKALQRNWIGKSRGAEVDFFIGSQGEDPAADFAQWKARRQASGYPSKPGPEVLRIYTTRPDTLFGATYMVIAPEHPNVARLTTPENAAAVEAYAKQASTKSDLDRTELAKEKTGVFTGSFAINPVNGEPIPIWVADYVLISYGTGAIMAVPAHDERDFEFARQFDLPIKAVVEPGPGVSDEDRAKIVAGEASYPEPGTAINSGEFNGLATEDFKQRIIDSLVEAGIGREAINFKLRDWLFSRQRFWGEPFPLLHELDAAGNKTGRIRAVPAEELPVALPHLDDFKPHGRPEPPLDKAPDEWLYPVVDGVKYKRETNTMPQWAGSCWYYLRFLDPHNNDHPVDPEIEKAWMPVDLYIGGAEHAVLHLLYARFWHKVLYDRGVVSTPEPFQKLVNQGMILGENNEKMSKARGNVVNPDDVVAEYGADSLRLYEMFMGPLEATKPWSMQGVSGVYNFLGRVWRLLVDERAEERKLGATVVDREPTIEEQRVLHKTIQAVTTDIDNLSFNTAIARMMEFVNVFTKQGEIPRQAAEPFVLLLSPFAPHVAEELWQTLGHEKTLAYEPWPQFDPDLARDSTVEIPVQINGKVRSKITIPAGADQGATVSAGKADPKVAELLAGKQIVKEIVVPGKLLNFVVK
jgi:leucyl-tRNA synthetase